MNVLTESSAGLIALTPDEALARIEQLRGQIQQRAAANAVAESEIRKLHPIAYPETAYEALV